MIMCVLLSLWLPASLHTQTRRQKGQLQTALAGRLGLGLGWWAHQTIFHSRPAAFLLGDRKLTASGQPPVVRQRADRCPRALLRMGVSGLGAVGVVSGEGWEVSWLQAWSQHALFIHSIWQSGLLANDCRMNE